MVAIAFVVAAAHASQPTHTPSPPAPPRYTGLWSLDTAKSEMGKRRPRKREDRVSEQGAWLSVRSVSVRASGDTLALDYRYRTDGGEAVNRVLGQDVRTKGRREGAALRFDSEAQLALFKFTVNERWSLSPDGRTLVLERTSRGPLGDEKQRLVFQRVGWRSP
jgi:hypothetical protein